MTPRDNNYERRREIARRIEDTFVEWNDELSGDAIDACAEAVVAFLDHTLYTAEAMIERLTADGYEIGISPIHPTSALWRVVVNDTRSGRGKIAYQATLLDALEEAASGLGVSAWASSFSKPGGGV